MKNIFLSIAFALVCGTIMCSCGGGNGTSGGAKVKQNEYLGKLPAIYAEADEIVGSFTRAANEKIQAMYDAGTPSKSEMEKMPKLMLEAAVKEEEYEKNLSAQVEAESKKLADKQWPVTYSPALGTPFYEVKSVTIVPSDIYDAPAFEITVVAREAFTADRNSAAYYVLTNEAGRIAKLKGVAWSQMNGTRDFAAGELLSNIRNEPMVFNLFEIENLYADLETFNGIEFITAEEWHSLKEF